MKVRWFHVMVAVECVVAVVAVVTTIAAVRLLGAIVRGLLSR